MSRAPRGSLNRPLKVTAWPCSLGFGLTFACCVLSRRVISQVSGCLLADFPGDCTASVGVIRRLTVHENLHIQRRVQNVRS